MTKEECEYCSEENDCEAKEHTIDCIFCNCQLKYPTNDTCPRCLHDRAWCECTEEEKNKEIDELFDQLYAKIKAIETKYFKEVA